MTTDVTGLQLEHVRQSVLDRCRRDDYAGYDPFDLLNSRVFQALPLRRWELARLAWLQLGKRSPLNMRRLLLVPRARNPKGVALFVLGLCEDYQRTGHPGHLEEAVALGHWLLSAACDLEQWRHRCWGYHFDWQARAFYVPKGTPNIITTTYVARALWSVGKLAGVAAFAEASIDAARFMRRSLLSNQDGRPFLAYIPGERAFVHNASLWGAAWCVQAGRESGDAQGVEVGLDVARHSVACQAADGSWRYGTLPHHGFIDGFHTGYNLEALHLIRSTTDEDWLDRSIGRGLDYYNAKLFEADGTPKYYSTSLYPIDLHSFSQAVIVLLRVCGGSDAADRAERVMHRAIELLYRPDAGVFAYQRGRWMLNRVNYMRWTQAWAYLALTALLRHKAESRDAAN